MRVLVTGGRTFDKWRVVSAALESANPKVIIQGGAPGADALARKWADVHGIPTVSYIPNWSKGKKAGPMRNSFMLEDSRPDVVVAFPGGRGTEDMVLKADAAGIHVVKVTA